METLAWLVDIPSETGDEAQICDEVAGRMVSTFGDGGVVRVGNSLVVGRRTAKPLVALVGHLDTVPSQGQGAARIERDRLYGLGSADMKGGVSVMIHLLEDPALSEGSYDVVGVFYEAEEGPAADNGLESVLQQVAWLQDADFAVVLEPCDRQIQVGCNGVVNAMVRFVGKSSHSARPWWGENAISKAGEWLTVMHRRQPEPHVVGGLEYKEVMSVTKAFGGIANNIIPAEFTLNLNYRFSPLRTTEDAVQYLLSVCDGADHVEIIDTAPSGPVETGHPFVTALAEASGSPLAPKQGWTDVARLGTYGVPAVNFGPGSAARAHQADEWVVVDDLDHAFDALRAVLTASAG